MTIIDQRLRIQRAQSREYVRHEKANKALDERMARLQAKCPHRKKRYCMGGVPEDSGYECEACLKWIG